jgi:hypothetical protein
MVVDVVNFSGRRAAAWSAAVIRLAPLVLLPA